MTPAKYILLAEDDPVVAELVLHALSASEPPPQVVHVRDGVEALDFLHAAMTCANHEGVTLNDPVPMTMTRVANIDRAQLLIESASRPTLQAFLRQWIATLRGMKTRVRWSIEVDPLDI